jgi:hypothetical protein
MWVLANRLTQAEGQWRPFEPQGMLGEIYQRAANLARTI